MAHHNLRIFMPEQIEAITSEKSKRKSSYEAWQAYQELYTPQKSIELAAPQKSTHFTRGMDSIDTSKYIHTLSQSTVQNSVQADSKPKLASTSAQAAFDFDSIIDMGKQLWNWISQVFTGTSQQTTGTSGKPGGDGTQPISGTPVLQTPNQIDYAMVQKLIKELQEQARRVEAVCNEAEEQIREDERLLLESIKKQSEIRQEGTDSLKFQLTFDQKKSKDICKERHDFYTQSDEIQKKQKFWGTVNSVATVASLVCVVAGTILAIGIPGPGIAVAALLGGGQIAIGIVNGGSQVMKAMLDQTFKEIQGKSGLNKHKYACINVRLQDEMELMQKGYDESLKALLLTKEILENMQKTSQFVLNR
jgi:hypothetical protein